MIILSTMIILNKINRYLNILNLIIEIKVKKSYNKILNEKYDLKKTADGFCGKFK